MILFTITTATNRYNIHDGGKIERTDREFTPSDTWLLLGFTKTQPFGSSFIPFTEITPKWLENNPLLFKNGKPRYTGVDFDHGTRRTWKNGIKTITFNTQKE